MNEPPSTRDKDTLNNDDRPPPSSGVPVRWDFIRFGFQQRAVESRLLDVVYDRSKL